MAVRSRDAAKSTAFASRHGAPKAYSELGDVLADPAVDAVYLSTPNALHAEQALAALAAGKHVLVEKPMALTVDDARAMAAAASARGLVLGIGFHLRFHPVHVEMRRMIAEGRIGSPTYVEGLFGSVANMQPGQWQLDPALAGHGSLTGLGVHLIDLLPWLLGKRIVEVAAISDGPSDERPVESLTTAVVRFDGGVQGVLTSSRRLANARNSVHVYGTEVLLEGEGTVTVNPRGRCCVKLQRAARTCASCRSPITTDSSSSRSHAPSREASRSASGRGWRSVCRRHLGDCRGRGHGSDGDALTPELAGKSVLITGGAGRFGFVVAQLLASEGAAIALADFGDARKIELLAGKLREGGAAAVAISADVTREDDCATNGRRERWRRSDARCRRSQRGHRGAVARVWEISNEEDWRRTVEVDLTGAFLTAKHAAIAMIPRRPARSFSSPLATACVPRPDRAHTTRPSTVFTV